MKQIKMLSEDINVKFHPQRLAEFLCQHYLAISLHDSESNLRSWFQDRSDLHTFSQSLPATPSPPLPQVVGVWV